MQALGGEVWRDLPAKTLFHSLGLGTIPWEHANRRRTDKNIAKVIQVGRDIFVDDGILAFEVLEVVNQTTIKVKARNNGFISSRKGVNLPDTNVDLPALSEKDKADLRFGVKNNVDMVFAVRCSCRTRRLDPISPPTFHPSCLLFFTYSWSCIMGNGG